MEPFALEVPEGESPLFVRIARAITGDIGRGRLRPGDALPGSRTLAKSLGVNRNTVVAALRELEQEGWLDVEGARATRVRAELPEARPRRFAKAAEGRRAAAIGFDLMPRAPDLTSPRPPKGAIALLGGLPDLRLVPKEALARAYRRVLKSARVADLLGYGDPRGELALRAALADLLSEKRALAVSADDVVVTRGSQMALYLAAKAVLEPGDRVAVEALGYRPAWQALREAGAELVPIPVDRSGIDVAAIAASAAKLKAVYLTPHHQYPTTVVLSAARRIALLETARAHRLAIFEDDYDHEFHYEGRPITPLASADRTGQVVYIGTLSKILAPALRIGFVVAPSRLLDRVAALRTVVDRQGDRLLELAVADLCVGGELSRHARKMRRIYAARREALSAALQAELGSVLSFHLPPGGMAIWAEAKGVDVDTWADAALEMGVVFQTARRFTYDEGRRRAVRLGFAAEPEGRLLMGARRMAKALEHVEKKTVLLRGRG